MVRRRVPLTVLAVVVGCLWFWAVLRLLLAPGQAGLVEGAVAAGGWGLSLLPVHVAGTPAERAGPVGAAPRGRVTTASRRRRWGGGSDPS
ncbi:MULTISPECIES: hypothetical protein [Streptomyces]|uniref:Integral membrane protein n=1 Tax=Streptomyces solicathayae TaxID=3081768 RepID=A0ABZ0LQF1_9ACTN|nr:hypothetical protein [Streptomyces sp. HUAS YS2]WOX21729.1 hypothetical protein R2D22_10060 [Streptomyces sp. HUAS YS2]